MKIRNRLSRDFSKIAMLVLNKTEVIHEDDKEEENEDFSDDEDLDAVFGHKQANRSKFKEKKVTGHAKKPSMGDLKVDVEGPIKIHPNQFHQRVPFSATYPSK
jgi:hypothetical protein